MLHINELTFRFGGRVIFDHATVAIPKGHRVALVGRNGTGKTTLLRLIAGEMVPDGGSITMPTEARLGIVARDYRDLGIPAENRAAAVAPATPTEPVTVPVTNRTARITS